MRWLIAIAVGTVFSASAAEVLKIGSSQQIIAISQDERAPWRTGDRVCVWETNQEIECGEVTKATAKAAIVKLDAPSDQIHRGARVRTEGKRRDEATREGRALGGKGEGAPEAREKPAPERREDPRQRAREARRPEIEEPEELLSPPPDVENEKRGRGERRPAAKLLTSYDKVEGVSNPDWNLSLGISAGFSFFFPMIHFQRRVSPYLSFGLMPLYFSTSGGSSKIGAVGGMVTFNYYGNEYFRGFWGQLGVGAYRFNATTATTEQSATSLSLLGTVGWRGYWDLGLNVGVGAGVQYVANPGFSGVTLNSVDFQPVFVLDVGISF